MYVPGPPSPVDLTKYRVITSCLDHHKKLSAEDWEEETGIQSPGSAPKFLGGLGQLPLFICASSSSC